MRYYLTAFLLIIIDQITKVLVKSNMYVGESIPILGDFFQLTYIRNTGAAFSMFSGQRVLLVAFPIIAMAIGIWYIHRQKGEHWTFYGSWALIVGGGIGNLIDRIAFGAVTDMLDFSIFPPIFNVADIGVTLGCALFMFNILMGEKLKK